MPATPARLSCEQCRQRKTKCDKGNPCTACKHAGISCTAVQRARLPRGRAVKSHKRGDKLESRLEQLESLIKQLESQVKPSPERKSPSSSDARTPSDKLDTFVARDFWVELSQEVAGLRDTLEESSEEGDVDSSSHQESPKPFWGNPSDALLTGYSLGAQNTNALDLPPEPMRKHLLELYRQRADCLFKVVHWPSTLEAIETQYDSRYTGARLEYTTSPSVRALEFAIYYVAVCTIDESECKQRFQTEKLHLLQRFRLATEISISRAKFLYAPDMTVLQAFVIYLLGLRACKEGALSWTLVAPAVRVATALRLPATDPEGRPTLELEVCRRVWFCIGVLDSQTAFDRGFPPITSLQDFASQPRIINDAHLSRMSVEMMSADPFTDMSFMYILQEATICLRKLVAPPKPTVGDEDPWGDWKAKVRTIAAFEDSMKQHRARIATSTKPIARFTEFSTEHISLNMHLSLRRPPYRRKHSPVPPWDNFNLLESTTNAMERVLRKGNDATFAPFIWFSQSWVEWNALAILLAELCTPRDDALAARAYTVAQLVYGQYEQDMAGPDAHMLWKPIAKLMRRVQKVRGVETSTDHSSAGQEAAASPGYFNPAVGHLDTRTAANQPAPVDTRMADLALEQPPVDGLSSSTQNVPSAPWFNDIETWQSNVNANMEPMSDMAWLNWDSFLGDLYSGTGANPNTFDQAMMQP